MIRRLNVYDAAQERLKLIFENFDYVYVSFSGGKDSGVLLNLCVDYIRRNLPGRKLGVMHMDYEAQYRQTTDYVSNRLADDSDILEVYHCCVPFKVATCTSMFQSYWRPWEDSAKDIWVREMPENCYLAGDFDFLVMIYGTMTSIVCLHSGYDTARSVTASVVWSVSALRKVSIDGAPYIVTKTTSTSAR